MNLKTCLWASLICVGSLTAVGEVPENYYSTLDGKPGEALVNAIRALSEGHAVVTYNTKTWNAFEKTDVRMVNGREAWWDMYSNNLVYLPEHAALNIEHSVANSWWGGKKGSTEAYSDLFHLNPSDQNANNKKGNYPPGEVTDARLLDNGLLRIGTPATGQGGGASSVFEPADEYKGDFARAYFYVFTAYSGLNWDSEYAYVYDGEGSLAPWAVELLLKWNREDPVDSKEISRNEEIYLLQNNRNPFIDYPGLAEYIWGEKQGSVFSLSAESVAVATDRPEAPVFEATRLTGVNTYALRWWDGYVQKISHTSGTLMVSIDGGTYRESDGMVEIDPAFTRDDYHLIKAYTVAEVDGRELRSSVSTLDMLARDPSGTDYSGARWDRVSDQAAFTPEQGPFLILSSNTLHTMSAKGGTTSTPFMESAGFVEFDSDGHLTELPADAAVVEFESAGSGKYRVMIHDIYGNYLGSWNSTAKNKMRLESDTYTPGTGAVGAEGEFIFTFDAFGSLQFNKTQPRFQNYESKQTPVFLYKFRDFNGGWSGIGNVCEDTPWGVGVDGDNIITDGETVIYDLSGRRVDGSRLGHGVYIVTGRGESTKIVL